MLSPSTGGGKLMLHKNRPVAVAAAKCHIVSLGDNMNDLCTAINNYQDTSEDACLETVWVIHGNVNINREYTHIFLCENTRTLTCVLFLILKYVSSSLMCELN